MCRCDRGPRPVDNWPGIPADDPAFPRALAELAGFLAALAVLGLAAWGWSVRAAAHPGGADAAGPGRVPRGPAGGSPVSGGDPRAALLARDYAALAAFARERFGADVAPEWFEFFLPRVGPGCYPLNAECPGDVAVWLKRQLEGLPAFDAGEVGPPEVRVTTTLHLAGGVGMPPARRRGGDDADRAPVARSKIGRAIIAIAPVNRVAARVAPPGAGDGEG